eukprot:scaffold100350_cov60-Phaeocystis_antarctica.AAC.1
MRPRARDEEGVRRAQRQAACAFEHGRVAPRPKEVVVVEMDLRLARQAWRHLGAQTPFGALLCDLGRQVEHRGRLQRGGAVWRHEDDPLRAAEHREQVGTRVRVQPGAGAAAAEPEESVAQLHRSRRASTAAGAGAAAAGGSGAGQRRRCQLGEQRGHVHVDPGLLEVAAAAG